MDILKFNYFNDLWLYIISVEWYLRIKKLENVMMNVIGFFVMQ